MNKKYYGHTVIRHPEGWFYLVAYNDENITLANSTMLVAWDKHGNIIRKEDVEYEEE